jgi:hypothetical protein
MKAKFSKVKNFAKTKFIKVNTFFNCYLPLVTVIGLFVALVGLGFAYIQILEARQAIVASIEPVIDITPRNVIPFSGNGVKFSINNRYPGDISNIEVTGTIVSAYRYGGRLLLCPLLYKTKPDEVIPIIDANSSIESNINLATISYNGVYIPLNSKAQFSAVEFLVISIAYTRNLDGREYRNQYYYSIDEAHQEIVDEEGESPSFIIINAPKNGKIIGESSIPIPTVESSGILEDLGNLVSTNMYINSECPSFRSDQENGADILVPPEIKD